MEEQTLVIIKPHIFQDYHEGTMLAAVLDDIQDNFRFAGLKVKDPVFFFIDEKFLRMFYAEHKNKPWFEKDLIVHMVMGKAMAFVVTGYGAINIVRTLIGDTNPAEASPGTVRYRYGRYEKGPNNAVHASDSRKSFERERALLREVGAEI